MMSKHKHDFKEREEKSASVSPDVSPPAPAQAGAEASGSAAAAPTSRAAEALAADLETARGEIAALRAEVAELNEKYLRKLADEVNFRKRMLREKEETLKYAASSLLSDFIPILDDFDRGIASVEAAKNYELFCEGVLLIRKQLSQMLENKYALKRFESKGEPFDPNRHEAMLAEPADVEEPMIAEEYLPGYSLHDRILRTAKVKVKIPAARKAQASQDAPADTAART